jgi:uncharacterized protein (DUF1015 family)
MASIKPFRALRPKTELAQQVASRPYDVLNSEEARAEANGNPFSFLHVTKSEIDLPANIDTHSQEVYDRAKENLQEFIKHDILQKEEKPCYYIYQLIMQGRSQTNTNSPARKKRRTVSIICARSKRKREMCSWLTVM